MFERIKNILRFRAVKRVYVSHERILIPLMLLVGVVIDVVTFRSSGCVFTCGRGDDSVHACA